MIQIDWKDPYVTGEFLIRMALQEDAACDDRATEALGSDADSVQICEVIAREEMVVAGWFLLECVYMELSRSGFTRLNEITQFIHDGSKALKGDVIGRIEGATGTILRGERIALNMLGKLSGIATKTAKYVKAVEGTGTEILDTRKTTPCFRSLERYAVRMGGGTNHRFDLAEMAMIKDNHLAAVGGVSALPEIISNLKRNGTRIEVEVDSLYQFKKVLPLEPERILLDNMSVTELRQAVEMAGNSKCYLEASGGITLETVTEIALTGVDGISSGSLTHSVDSADMSFDWGKHGR